MAKFMGKLNREPVAAATGSRLSFPMNFATQVGSMRVSNDDEEEDNE